MNNICIYCRHKEIVDGEFRCSSAKYEFNEGYGPFKKGCVCIFDSDLQNLYKPVNDIASLAREIKEEKEKYELENMKLRDHIRKLEKRLLDVGE